MPDSQIQRKGASLVLSEKARLQELLERVTDLEQQLAADLKNKDKKTKTSNSNSGNSNSNSEEKAAKLRTHLCEVLSDLILSDPVLALEHDATGKLWRSCFYAPIGVWRKKLSREKRKQPQGAAAATTGGGGASSSLKALEQNFHKFLREAMALYEYLVIQYQSKLVPPSPSGEEGGSMMSQENSQDMISQGSYHLPVESSSTDAITGTFSTEGVVPGLYRLFIQMGDLHRYAESYGKAESYYLNASRLAPGMGNPYNQLAVVSQMKSESNHLSCVALYWYCRSLLATHDSFETSTSNLERLFGVNRTYLEEHSRNAMTPPIFTTTTNASAAKNHPNKIMASDMLRAQKAAATKACLAHFVDFHFELFQQNADHAPQNENNNINNINNNINNNNINNNNNNNNNNINNTETRLREKTEGIIRSFDSLVQASAFSDSLLVKMVVICTFSIERSKNNCSNSSSSNNNSEQQQDQQQQQQQQVRTKSRIMAEEFLLRLGACLAERLLAGSKKILDKNHKQQQQQQQSQPQKPNSIRLLLPLSILLEYYVGQEDFPTKTTTTTTTTTTLRYTKEFWERLAAVATTLRQLLHQVDAAATPLLSDQISLRAAGDSALELKEFKMLKGYKPFAFLWPSYSSESAHVDAEDAICVLDLQPTQSQGSQSTIKPRDDSLERLARFVASCDLCSTSSCIPLTFQNGQYSCQLMMSAPVSAAAAAASDVDADDSSPTEAPTTILAGGSNETMDVTMDGDDDDDDDDEEAGDLVVDLDGPAATTSSTSVEPSDARIIPGPKQQQQQQQLPLGGTVGSTRILPVNTAQNPYLPVASAVNNAAAPPPPPPPPMAVKPPPGFGMPTTTSSSASSTSLPPPPMPPPPILPGGSTGAGPTLPPNPFAQQQQQQQHSQPDFAYPMSVGGGISGPPANLFPTMQAAYSSYPSNQYHHHQHHQYQYPPNHNMNMAGGGHLYPPPTQQVLGQSMDFLGGGAGALRTNNPFLDSSGTNNNNNNNLGAYNTPGGWPSGMYNNNNNNNNSMYSQSSDHAPNFSNEDTSMLGSGLLESLFMTDPASTETKNPFAR